ncbi:MAG: type III-B CRISPR module-associated protein Cmr3 [Meiothermus sp.]|uniref:type III-B CRISPR module-associated protein Cmr3 n=1 Tax=Meiothermus sp. TaxID=1955249 RepID=UPI0025FCBE83|nr:type III-B CRISPR module-associated protein Cmr3 [Meiothermus sp.]MCS7069584.1 type III-B CRISPR module-associated protein Cmr3 [Meiothermus sp.]MDW8425979.1 type III-B CRISPR module-associated protein Cmr3 [Meiothermus sp.]
MLIEPRDPIVARDGRPFSSNPGARARSLPFPLPQTIAGAVRTRIGLSRGLSFPGAAQQVRQIGIRGPLLAERGQEGWRLLAPAPADALLLGQGEASFLYRLVPLSLGKGIETNLPEGLHPVGIPNPDNKSKPLAVPRFWHWTSFERWLLEPPAKAEQKGKDLGHDGPQGEVRTHLKLSPETQTAEEGFLFQTSGLEFTFARQDARQKPLLSSARRLALALWVEDAPKGVFPLAGERRLAFWLNETIPPPQPPAALLQRLVQHQAARVIFLTPAAFRAGYLPENRALQGARIEAAALGRATVASGWDLEQHRPKPSRRLVPAGSVYFVRFAGWSESRIREWLDGIWMQNLSDEPQDRLDGYGLAVVGSWTGALAKLEV